MEPATFSSLGLVPVFYASGFGASGQHPYPAEIRMLGESRIEQAEVLQCAQILRETRVSKGGVLKNWLKAWRFVTHLITHPPTTLSCVTIFYLVYLFLTLFIRMFGLNLGSVGVI